MQLYDNYHNSQRIAFLGELIYNIGVNKITIAQIDQVNDFMANGLEHASLDEAFEYLTDTVGLSDGSAYKALGYCEAFTMDMRFALTTADLEPYPFEFPLKPSRPASNEVA